MVLVLVRLWLWCRVLIIHRESLEWCRSTRRTVCLREPWMVWLQENINLPFTSTEISLKDVKGKADCTICWQSPYWLVQTCFINTINYFRIISSEQERRRRRRWSEEMRIDAWLDRCWRRQKKETSRREEWKRLVGGEGRNVKRKGLGTFYIFIWLSNSYTILSFTDTGLFLGKIPFMNSGCFCCWLAVSKLKLLAYLHIWYL